MTYTRSDKNKLCIKMIISEEFRLTHLESEIINAKEDTQREGELLSSLKAE
jgi:hypothetical protein